MDMKRFRFYDLDLRAESYKDFYINSYGEACEINEFGEVEVSKDNIIVDEFTGFLLDEEPLFTSDLVNTTLETSSGETGGMLGLVYFEPEINSFAVEFWLAEDTGYISLVDYMSMFGDQTEIQGIYYDDLTDEEIERIIRAEDDGEEAEW